MTGRSPLNPVLIPSILVAILVISVVFTTASWAQEGLPEGISMPDYEPRANEETMARSDMGNVAQTARMEYNSGVRDLAKAQKLREKAAAATDAKDKAKAEAKAQSALESADKSFREALSFDGELIEAYTGLGTVLRLQGKLEESLQVHAMALRQDPEDMENFAGWVQSLLALNMLGNATTAYTDYRQTRPDRAEVLMTAIEQWLDDKQAEPGAVDPADVQRLADWVEQQKQG